MSRKKVRELRQWVALIFDSKSHSYFAVASRSTLVELEQWMARQRKHKNFVIAQKRMSYTRF